MPISIPDFASAQLTLLATELAAETESTTTLIGGTSPLVLARLGLAVPNLVISSQRIGLGGKTVFELEQDHAIGTDGVLTEHGIRVGDIVHVGPQPKGGERKAEMKSLEGKGVNGVVVRVQGRGLQVALDGEGGEEQDGLGGRLWV
jgi:DNA polymerase alpha-associated DNA helicase A